MQLADVNFLVDAYRTDSATHDLCARWLQDLYDGEEAFGVSDLVCSGFLRVVTHRRIFNPPSPIEDALIFLHQLRTHPNCVQVAPGARHWEIFVGLCQSQRVHGKLVPDAYFAALAIESGSEWITNDGDYSRFPGLRWRRPTA